MDTTKATAGAVEKARIEAGISRKQLSELSGIPYATLYRLLEGQSDFKIPQIEAVARVLDVAPSSLVRFADAA